MSEAIRESPGGPWKGGTEVKLFTVTADHIVLARRLCVEWDDSEYNGAPTIDLKRPYGSEGAYYIAECLGWPEPFTDEQREKALAIHREMETALQVFLQTGEFRAGEYQRRDSFSLWERQAAQNAPTNDGEARETRICGHCGATDQPLVNDDPAGCLLCEDEEACRARVARNPRHPASTDPLGGGSPVGDDGRSCFFCGVIFDLERGIFRRKTGDAWVCLNDGNCRSRQHASLLSECARLREELEGLEERNGRLQRTMEYDLGERERLRERTDALEKDRANWKEWEEEIIAALGPPISSVGTAGEHILHIKQERDTARQELERARQERNAARVEANREYTATIERLRGELDDALAREQCVRVRLNLALTQSAPAENGETGCGECERLHGRSEHLEFLIRDYAYKAHVASESLTNLEGAQRKSEADNQYAARSFNLMCEAVGWRNEGS